MTGRAGAKALEVFTANGAAAARVQFEAENIRAKVNDYLGPGAVGRIIVQQTGVQQTGRQSGATVAAASGGQPESQAIDGAEAKPAAGLESALGRFRASISARRRQSPLKPGDN